MFKCFICGEDCIWNSDFSYEEVYQEEVEGVVSYFTCTNPNCKAEYEVTQRFDEEE